MLRTRQKTAAEMALPPSDNMGREVEVLEVQPKPRASVFYVDGHAHPAKPAGRPSSGKVVVSLRLSTDVIDKFRATGKGWQARIDEVLRKATP